MIPDEKRPMEWLLPPTVSSPSVDVVPSPPLYQYYHRCSVAMDEKQQQQRQPLVANFYPSIPTSGNNHCKGVRRWLVVTAAVATVVLGLVTVGALKASYQHYLGHISASPLHAVTSKYDDYVSNQVIRQLIRLAKDKHNSVAWDRLAEMTDLYGHRMTGSEGYDRSAEWILQVARSEDGLAAVAENVTVNVWERGHESLQLLTRTRPGNNGTVDLPVLGLGLTKPTPPQGIEGQVVPVHSFEELEELGNATIAGKIVLYNVPFDEYGTTVKFRTRGATEAEKYGAIAVLVRSVTPFSMGVPHTGFGGQSGIPVAAITAEDAAMIERMHWRHQRAAHSEAQSRGDGRQSPPPPLLYAKWHDAPQVRLTLQSEYHPRAKESANVVMEIKGSERPEEIVLLSGHLDSWDIGVGAMDDGAGAFMAWEALRMISLATAQNPPRRTIMWNNEETFQAGARGYLDRHRDEIANHMFALESDIGVFKPWGLTATSKSRHIVKILKAYGQAFLARHDLGGHVVATDDSGGTDVNVLCKANPNIICSEFLSRDVISNKSPLRKGGTWGYFYYHHSAADRMEVLNPDDLRKSAAAVAIWAYVMASLPPEEFTRP
ncbi:hypothetical protein EV182_000613 [Spiromyces aspiralis]|uniref:Uncharacterized protein n=1 Tax=Spiromyces aspiralis TaxID=68401 RepID=A0ACC1HU64_9FUNG|nr:hypothetical protein EV182_000613 [Spiromyces aspiralis]